MRRVRPGITLIAASASGVLVLLTVTLLILSHRMQASLADVSAATDQAIEIGDEIQMALSAEVAAIVGFQATDEAQYRETYRAHITAIDWRVRRLEKLCVPLGATVKGRLVEVRAAIDGWQRRIDSAELITRKLPPGAFRREAFEHFSVMKRAQGSTNAFNRSVLEYQSSERARMQRLGYLFMALAVVCGPLALFALTLMIHVVRRLSTSTSHLEKRAREEEALRRIGHSLTGGLTVDDVLRRITDAILLSGQAEDVWIETIDTSRNEATCVAASGGRVPAKGAKCAYEGSLAQAVLLDGQPRIVQTSALEGQPDSIFRDVIRRSGNRSAMVIPLVADNRPLGALCLLNRPGSTFSDAEAATVRTLADMASIALQRAMTVEQMQKLEDEERLLAEISATLASSLDYSRTIKTVAQLAVSHMADWCFVHLVEGQRIYHAEIATADPAKKDIARRLCEKHRARPDLTISVENAIRTGQAYLLPEVTDDRLRAHSVDADHFELLRQIDLKSVVIVPLTVGVETIGALLFGAAGSRRFDDDDLKRATNIGRRAALAIHNAQLYAVANEAIQLREGVLRTVAHDLRNPLSTIELSARMLAEPSLPHERRQKLLQSITGASARMNRLIDDLLLIGRLRGKQELPLDLHREDPADIVQQVGEIMKPQALAKFIALEWHVTEPAATSVTVDRARILQVLMNLVDNALKFTPRGGRVSVSCEAFDREVRFVVQDTGRGIDPDHLEKIFDPFWQAGDNANLGAGLGLAISKAIIERHHGRIWVESRLGIGTTVSFTLPVAGVDEERLRGASPDVVVASAGGISQSA
jgi:signal transduction histidine kinase